MTTRLLKTTGLAAGLAALAVPAGGALAFDCTKAQAPVEKLICASPALIASDDALGKTYCRLMAEAQARDPSEALKLRDAQRAWIASRNASCVKANAPQAESIACLSQFYTRRLAELGGLASKPAAQPAKPALQSAQAPAGQATKPSTGASASPAGEVRSSQSEGQVVAQQTPEPAPVEARPAPAAPRQAEAVPALPSRPEPSARLTQEQVPAAGEGQALLEVTAPGRFSVRAESKTGVALQLVDMIAGPQERMGEAGARDGRIDALLDKGVYKIRTFGAKGAPGTARLTVATFKDAGPLAGLSEDFSGELNDLQQRSFMIAVGKSGKVAVEAMGRALSDLRLWRNGADLVGLAPELLTVEPKAGRPVMRARIEGSVEPGVYVVTAYGGEPIVWTDGDKASPFRIRKAKLLNAAGGAAEGVIGPFGVERFELPASANYVRLELPEPTAATLRASRGGSSFYSVITKSHRDPVAALTLPVKGGEGGQAEIVGFEGQSYKLRALTSATQARIDTSGRHLIFADVAGEGGDELPATGVLARFGKGKTTGVAIASSAPRLGNGQAWRRKFNIRGTSTIVFEMTAPGPIALQGDGPLVSATIEPILGYNAPTADGKTPAIFNLEAGWYVLKLEPVNGAVGVMDLTFGQPGLKPEIKAPAAPRTAISFGTHSLDAGDYLLAVMGSSPGVVMGPRAVALPADLSKGPAVVLQTAPDKAAGAPVPPVKPAPAAPGKAGQPAAPTPAPAPAAAPVALEIPVTAPVGGRITAADAKGGAVAVTFTGEKVEKNSRTLTVKIPPSAAQRTVVISWAEDRASDEALPKSIQPEAPLEALAAGAPRYFNMEMGDQRNFRLDVAEGGLYRVETLGRLKTAVAMSTPFLPNLDQAENNGTGHNGLMQTYLRSGSYRVNVKVSHSAGRLALTARPAPLIESGALVPEGDARVSLTDGRGAVIPLDIKEEGDYQLDLYGLGREFTVRLEDAEGWPLAVPGPVSSETQHFTAGRYRMVVLPQETDARLVVRLRKKVEEKATEGHGPHPLAFDRTQAHEWREPASKEAPRDPDRWVFELAGEANVTLDLSDGMAGDLFREGTAEPVARIAYKAGYSGKLEPGKYRLDARSLGRNDRLDYKVTLRSTELQPGFARFVTLPVTETFAIGEDRVVSLTTYGRTDLNAVLKEAESGRVVERLSGRTDDWNIGLSRRLPMGAYRLELQKVGGKKPGDSGESSSSEGEGEGENGSGEAASAPAGKDAVEVRLALPAAESGPALAMGRAEMFVSKGVRQFAVPAGEAGRLNVAAAEADAELVLSLEREEGGRWIAQGFERGRSPVIAWPTDAKGGKQRLSVWTVDGGEAQVAIAVQGVASETQAVGKIALKPVALDGVRRKIRVALVNAPAASLVALAGEHKGLSQGSTLGAPLAPTTGGVLAPQTDRLWLLSAGEGDDMLRLESLGETARDISLALAEGETAHLSAVPASPSGDRLWLAESRFGQPGLSAEQGMGVAGDSVLAISGRAGASLKVWNAAGHEPLRVRVKAVDVTPAGNGAVKVDGQFVAVLPPFTSQELTFADQRGGQFTVDLAPGTAAFVQSDKHPVTVWAGREAVSRTVGHVSGFVELVNATNKPAPVRATMTPAGDAPSKLAAGQVFKRFFGATGSLSLPVDAQARDVLVTAGADATFIGADGRIVRGRRLPLTGPGEVVIEHGAGLVAAWLERAGQSPWTAARAATAKLPGAEKLGGEAMTFAISADAPMLLHARTTAPVIVALNQGGEEAPELYPAGAELHRYVAPGKAELRVYSPHDGPLSGVLELSSSPVAPVKEGVGDPVALSAGGTALFGFELTRPGPVGAGVRSEPDVAQMRLLDSKGKALGEGVNVFKRLEPGRYVIEARVPASGGAVVVRPSVVGVAPPPAGPPPEVVEGYLEMAGMKSTRGR